MTHYETIIIERHGPVGWLINNRPEALNAQNEQQRTEMADAWLELDADPQVRVIVQTGAGRAFHSGADMSEISDKGMDRFERDMLTFNQHFTPWHQNVSKPVIAAINGVCAGAGLHFVADADIVIAASDATFVDPHVSVGQVTAIETIGLAKKIPFEAVMRMALVGKYERMPAQRAYELGMVSQIVDPPEKLRDEAQALAEKIARNSPAALAATKKAIWGSLELGLSDACRLGSQHLISVWGHPDQTEGPLSFVEKREPQWQSPR